jgi:hypothetical protein
MSQPVHGPAYAVLLLLTVGLPRIAGAQQTALARGDILDLARSGVSSSRIVTIAAQKCLAFRLDSAAEADLARGGASSELIAGLRSVCTTAPAPVPAGSPKAPVSTAIADIPVINGRVAYVRFFEGANVTAAEGRQYRYRFPQATTRTVNWELELANQPMGRRVDFRIEAVAYMPDGTEFFRDTMSTGVEPAWAGGSKHSMGRGWPTPGLWTVGVYRVDFLVEGRRVAVGNFEITPPTAQMPDLPVLSATITSLSFWEGVATATAAGDSVGRYRFPAATTRYIYYRLALQAGKPGRHVDLPILVVYYGPGGAEKDRFTVQHAVESDWTAPVLRAGTGAATAGSWTPGTYRVEFSYNGQRIGVGSFDVY